MLEFDVKKYVEDGLVNKAKEYRDDHGIAHLFADPIIGYAWAKSPLFEAFYDRGWSLHPKEIYRPANTVVVHFLPFARGLNQEDFSKAQDASLLYAAILNDNVKGSLEKLGRLVSLTALPGDWDKDKDDHYWSHKLAAFVAGLGEFGLASSFNTVKGNLGRFDSVLTEMVLEPSKQWPDLKEDAIADILQDIIDAQRFGSEAVGAEPLSAARLEALSADLAPIDTAIIDRCPAKAINTNFIDKQKCRNYCRSLDQVVPVPDGCGRCFNPHSV